MPDRLSCIQSVQTRRGLTLIELIVVLALLSIVFAALIQFFMAAQRSWTSTEIQNRLSDEANVVLANISREVRSAQKPNGLSTAVSNPNITQQPPLANRSRLDLYRFDSSLNTMIRVQYRLEAGILQRGWVASAQPYPGPYFWDIATGAMLYPVIPDGNWTTLMTGVTNLDLFTFLTDATTSTQSIRVELAVNDTAHPLTQPIRVDVEYTVRGK